MWGWSWEAREQGEADWAGVLTAPRVVDVHPDGALRVTPAPELRRLRAAEPFVTAPGRAALPTAYDLTVSARGHTTVSLLRSASGAELTVRLDPGEGTVTLDRGDWPRAQNGAPVVVRVPPDEELTVRVLADGSLYELFVGDRATVTERVYHRPGDTRELGVSPGATVTGWELVPPTNG
jgi:beta-fructofuranosidase